MTLRKLARLCEHDEIRKHWVNPGGIGPYGPGHEWDGSPWMCPGGEFLAEDTLDLEALATALEAWDGWINSTNYAGMPPIWAINKMATAARFVLDALTVREGADLLDPWMEGKE